MKNEVIEEIDQRVNDAIEIYKDLGWTITALDPCLFQYFWADITDGHFISKLRAHLSSLDKDVDNYFQPEKKELFKKAVQDFIETSSKYRAINIQNPIWYLKLKGNLEKAWCLRQMRKRGKIAFCATHILMANCKKKEDG